MYCDLIELPCGVTRPRYHPRTERLQLYKPRGAECDTCTRPERHWYTDKGRRVGPMCWGQATYSEPPTEEPRRTRRRETARTGLDLFGEEW